MVVLVVCERESGKGGVVLQFDRGQTCKRVWAGSVVGPGITWAGGFRIVGGFGIWIGFIVLGNNIKIGSVCILTNKD